MSSASIVSNRSRVLSALRLRSSVLIPLLIAVFTLSTAPSVALAVTKKSISNWVNCAGGTADDTTGAIAAFEAAKHNAFTLVVDCQVHLHSGSAIDRGIFIDTGTTVEFTSAGKFFIDNLFHPAFVIADSNDITLTNWNVEWDGVIPVDPDVNGYYYEGKWVSVPNGALQPAGAFNDVVFTPWMTKNRYITFSQEKGYVKPIWVGAVNTSAVFYITGDTYNIAFTGLHLYAPANVPANHFIPMGFSFSANYKPNQTVYKTTPIALKYVDAPHQMTFSGVTLDGTLMGFQGNLKNVLFEEITSLRYADLMDTNGNNVGGIGKWFPPPHLFYLNYNEAGDKYLFNTNIHMETVNDLGPRLGTARDKTAAGGKSGFTNSLKIGCTFCSVNDYVSHRPDGFMDLLASSYLTVSNVTAVFDSSFTNYLYPNGVRFTDDNGYAHVTFTNVNFSDTAATTLNGPVGNAPSSTNVDIDFNDVEVAMKHWGGSDFPTPTMGGNSNSINLNYTMASQLMKVTHVQKNTLVSTVQATPATIRVGTSTTMKWSARNASTCSASGVTAATVRPFDSLAVKLAAAGTKTFSLRCANSTASTVATVQLLAK
jgi:hypothetical protein